MRLEGQRFAVDFQRAVVVVQFGDVVFAVNGDECRALAFDERNEFQFFCQFFVDAGFGVQVEVVAQQLLQFFRVVKGLLPGFRGGGAVGADADAAGEAGFAAVGRAFKAEAEAGF